MIRVAGVGAESYAKRHYDAAMRTQLEVGLLEFCGIEERRFELLYRYRG
jgi:NAD(P)H dehydrogenase (quinone)